MSVPPVLRSLTLCLIIHRAILSTALIASPTLPTVHLIPRTSAPQRNQNPAALLRDRHSRSGLLKNTEQLRKNGAGAHNWGSFRQEGEHEQEAGADALFDMEDTENRDPASRPPSLVQDAEVGSENKEVLGDPATSPSESMSSLDSGEAQVNGNGGGNKVGMGPRRMSNVSEEERERARVYREGVMNKGGESGTVSRCVGL